MPPPLSPCLFAPMDFYIGFNARWFCCEAHSTLSIDSSIIFMMCKFSQVNFAHFDFFSLFIIYTAFFLISLAWHSFFVCAQKSKANRINFRFLFSFPHTWALSPDQQMLCVDRVWKALSERLKNSSSFSRNNKEVGRARSLCLDKLLFLVRWYTYPFYIGHKRARLRDEMRN